MRRTMATNREIEAAMFILMRAKCEKKMRIAYLMHFLEVKPFPGTLFSLLLLLSKKREPFLQK
jgi:hypothetical protein